MTFLRLWRPARGDGRPGARPHACCLGRGAPGVASLRTNLSDRRALPAALASDRAAHAGHERAGGGTRRARTQRRWPTQGRAGLEPGQRASKQGQRPPEPGQRIPIAGRLLLRAGHADPLRGIICANRGRRRRASAASAREAVADGHEVASSPRAPREGRARRTRLASSGGVTRRRGREPARLHRSLSANGRTHGHDGPLLPKKSPSGPGRGASPGSGRRLGREPPPTR